MIRRTFLGTLLAAGTLPLLRGQTMTAQQAGTSSADALALTYARAARRWVEALPLGNGRLGAMVFGGIDVERLQLNEDTLWSGAPRPGTTPAHGMRCRRFARSWRPGALPRPMRPRARCWVRSPSPTCRSATCVS